MILTITPNPSIDLLFETAHLVWDDANRTAAPRRRPGGQGINLTRAARALGASSIAVALLGGHTGGELEQMLSDEGTPLERIDIAGDTRLFVGARETSTGRSLLLNPRGPQIGAYEVDGIVASIRAAIERVRPSWVACCGSIPPGLPAGIYARIGAAAHECGARFVPDCDGEALRLAAAHADLLSPNLHEAERLLGLKITDATSAGNAARRLVQSTTRIAAIKLGADGAVLSDGEATWFAAGPRMDHGSAVGAGDAFLAALLVEVGRNAPLDQALRRAVAAGAAVLQASGSDLLSATVVEQVYENVQARPLD
jgi:1-phosphofructokinase family hexose kinase